MDGVNATITTMNTYVPQSGWLQGMIAPLRDGVYGMVPGWSWLIIIGLSAATGWYVVYKLKNGFITSTTLGGIIAVLTFLALKYIGL